MHTIPAESDQPNNSSIVPFWLGYPKNCQLQNQSWPAAKNSYQVLIGNQLVSTWGNRVEEWDGVWKHEWGDPVMARPAPPSSHPNGTASILPTPALYHLIRTGQSNHCSKVITPQPFFDRGWNRGMQYQQVIRPQTKSKAWHNGHRVNETHTHKP